VYLLYSRPINTIVIPKLYKLLAKFFTPLYYEQRCIELFPCLPSRHSGIPKLKRREINNIDPAEPANLKG